MAEQSLKEFYDSLIGASANWHKIEYNWRDVALCVCLCRVGSVHLQRRGGRLLRHNILWLVIFSVTDPTALILIMSVLTEEICL